MARHSHWHNIQATKGKADAKRAKSFAKLAKAITVAARDGGRDPSFNVSLRVAIDSARSANMPKDNIERAISRGAGEGGETGQIEELVYEAFGPGGSALLIQCLTDNRNRSLSEVRTVLMKNGGNMAGQGSVSWMFDKKGLLIIEDTSTISDKEAFELALIESGAEDIQESDSMMSVVTPVTEFKKVFDAIERQGVETNNASLAYIAKESVEVSEDDSESLSQLIEKLDELDDVDTVFTNAA